MADTEILYLAGGGMGAKVFSQSLHAVKEEQDLFLRKYSCKKWIDSLIFRVWDC